jgi:hypothetical protein
MNGSSTRRFRNVSSSATGPTGAALTATIRWTPAARMARRISRVAVDATGPSLRPRGPMPDSTASHGSSAVSAVRSGAVTTVSEAWSAENLAASRTTAVTWWPASSAWRTTCPPTPPVAPKTVIFIRVSPARVPCDPHPISYEGDII